MSAAAGLTTIPGEPSIAQRSRIAAERAAKAEAILQGLPPLFNEADLAALARPRLQPLTSSSKERVTP